MTMTAVGRELAPDALGGLEAAGRRQRQVHQHDARARHAGHLDRGASIGRLADDVEVALRPGLARCRRGRAHGRRRSGCGSCRPRCRLGGARRLQSRLSSDLLLPGIGMPMAPGGMVIRTAVPRFGLDRTSNRAPISSARSRMNCSPKMRRPLTGGTSASKPLPSSRTSTTQPSLSLDHPDADAASAGRACARSGALPG